MQVPSIESDIHTDAQVTKVDFVHRFDRFVVQPSKRIGAVSQRVPSESVHPTLSAINNNDSLLHTHKRTADAVHSGLKPKYFTICDHTEAEIETVFAPELPGLDRRDMRGWYNGYSWLGEKVYNPIDVLMPFDKREFAPYLLPNRHAQLSEQPDGERSVQQPGAGEPSDAPGRAADVGGGVRPVSMRCCYSPNKSSPIHHDYSNTHDLRVNTSRLNVTFH